MSDSPPEALASSSNTIKIFNGGSLGCIIEVRGAAAVVSVLKREFFID